MKPALKMRLAPKPKTQDWKPTHLFGGPNKGPLVGVANKWETGPIERRIVQWSMERILRSIGNRKRPRHPLLKADIMGPEGPLGTYFEVHVTPQKFELLKQYNFVRIIVGSVDSKLDKELLLKDIETFLCLVPDYIPAILLIMEREEYEERVNSLTVFRLNDGKRTRDYLLAHATDRK